jgi:hypothetical protein
MLFYYWLLLLHFTLCGSESEHALPAWNNINITDASNTERI